MLIPLPRLHAVPVILQQIVSVAVVIQVLSSVYFNAKLHRHCEKSLIGDFFLACLYTDVYTYIYIFFTHVIGLNMFGNDSNDEDDNNEDNRNNHNLRLRVGKTACYLLRIQGWMA